MPDKPKPDRGDDAVQSYFRKIRGDYQDSVARDDISGVHERIKARIGPRLGGLVLDIGSGGVSDYAGAPGRTVVSVDNVFEFLSHSRESGVRNVAGDIRALPFREGTVDRVIIQHVVHHLTDNLLAKNLDNVRRAAAETARVLRRGGRAFIVDSMGPLWMEALQRSLYATSFHLLKLARRPMVFFFSPRALARILRAHGLAVESIEPVDWGRMTQLSQALFPGLKFPLRYSPVQCVIITAVKP